MLEERYHAIIAAYGADPKRWPESERAAALAFAAAGDGAARREEAALDALLGAYGAAQEPGDDEAAMAHILAAFNAQAPTVVRLGSARAAPARAIAQSGRRASGSNWLNERRMMAAGFLFAALAGLTIGFNGAGVGLSTADASDELVVSYALADG